MITICFGDIHFGKRGDSVQHNERCIEYVRWLLGQAELHRADRIAFLGDWHDSRSRIGVETLNRSTEAFELLEADRREKLFVIGNHDMPQRETRAGHSLPWAPKYSRTRVVQDPTIIDSSLFLPYLVPSDDKDAVAAMGSDCEFVFGHLELPGFMMNEGYVIPHREGRLAGDDFKGPRYVFTGHFHKRQRKRARSGTWLHYIGNAFPHDFSDEGDSGRGAMVIESGKEPVYLDWPDAPTYHRVLVSELADRLPLLGSRATVRAVPDVDMAKGDREEITEMVSRNFELASFVIEPVRAEAAAAEAWDGGQDIDSFAINWLGDPKNTEGTDLDNDTLVRMYKEARVGKDG